MGTSILRILIVEDEQITAMTVKGSLEKFGYLVCGIASSCEEAIERVAELEPDLVLMDIALEGGLDGITAAAEIRRRYNIPVVFLTAYFDENTVLRAIEAEPFGYVIKPYHPKSLYITIKMAVSRSLQEKAFRESQSRYQSLFNASRDAIFIFNESGGIIDCNPAMRDLARFRGETCGSLHLADIAGDRSEELMRDLLKKGEIRDVELTLRRIDGSRVDCLLTAGVVPAEHGEPACYQGMLRDITRRKERLELLKRTMDGFIQTIALIVEAKDPYTAGHQRRVTTIAGAIADELGLAADRRESIVMAGIIHDLGKISVPTEILSKPGKISSLEMNIIRIHPEVGFNILKNIDFPWPIAEIVYEHHERMDGSGYPRGLSDEDIRLESRILAVADVVEAMASHRPYRAALGVEAALTEIRRMKGVLYDASVVDACIRIFEENRVTL